MGSYLLNLIFISTLLSITTNFAATPESTVQLDRLIQEGLEKNPDLKASYNTW